MTRLSAALVVLIGVAAVVGAVVWAVRYQPFGPGRPVGTPLATDAPAAAGWLRTGDAPVARLEMATAVHEGRFWLAGGLTPEGGVVDELRIFDPATGEWSDGPPLPEAVHHAALASEGGLLHLVGGYRGSDGQPTDAVRVLDPARGEWTDGAPLPEPRAAGAVAFDGQRLVYAGGVGPGGVSDEVFALQGDAWAEIGLLARPREHLAATSDADGRVWIMGGRQGGLDRNVGDVELVEGEEVALVATVTPRGGVAAFFDPSLGACLTGGEAPALAFSLVECVDREGRLTALPEMTQRRHGHGAGVVDGVAYALLGGEIQGLNATATVEELRTGD